MSIDYGILPDHMQDGARRYIEKGIKPGSFQIAVFSNDLIGAFERADPQNAHAMRNWAVFLHNHAPRGCYGSPEKVEQWLEVRGLEGLAALADMEAAADRNADAEAEGSTE